MIAATGAGLSSLGAGRRGGEGRGRGPGTRGPEGRVGNQGKGFWELGAGRRDGEGARRWLNRVSGARA